MQPPVLSILSRLQRAASRRGWCAAAAAVLAAVTVAGCGTAPTDAGGEGAVTLEHGHGLGVDPPDGQLYAGTHPRPVRVSPAGRLPPGADRGAGHMGFTRLAPG